VAVLGLTVTSSYLCYSPCNYYRDCNRPGMGNGRMGGLTERNKQRTRRQIGEAALRLFLERGFDHVTVAEVAAAAEVSEKTVYNYFPTKAHLVFDDDQTVLDELVAALRSRAAGTSALTAIRGALSNLAGRMGEGRPASARAAFRRMVTTSVPLRTHQRTMAARYEQALAEVLAEQTGAPPGSAEPFVAAVALVGALRAGFEAAEGSGGGGAAITRALDLLEAGLAGYAPAAIDPAADPP
jgi:AcrR family transcriptional regulator